jgi:hypothetical protein
MMQTKVSQGQNRLKKDDAVLEQLPVLPDKAL